MTTETMDLQGLLEKSTDPDFLRQMIGFTAQRLMELEVEGLTGAAPGARSPARVTNATAIATAIGKPAPAPSHSGSQSCARAVTSRPSWNRAGWQGRR